jgi:ribose transport system ATP-binding protein
VKGTTVNNINELAPVDTIAPTSGVTPPVVLLSLVGIGKTFPGVRALHDVNLEVRAGEVHALVGENGAGKSTLMAVASGALAPDQGSIEIGGVALTSASPDEARDLGLAIVRQDPALLPDLTVAENMAIGVGFKRVGGLRNAPKWTQERLDPWQMGVDARTRIADLTVEQRFIVEIAKAIALDPKVLILDEPTEHLSLEEVQRLFRRVREIVAGNAAVVYISHRIPEVKEVADRITVLRDGQVRGTFEASGVTESQIVERVIGRSLDTVFPNKADASVAGIAEYQLAVRNLTSEHFHDVNFAVKSGEIVGLAGVQGNGQSELIRALAGLGPATGTLHVAGRPVKLGNNYAAAQAGTVYVPADRHGEGVFLPLAVSENVVMKTLPEVAPGGAVRESLIHKIAITQIRNLAIKAPSPRAPISTLSGGNQQKVVLARTLLSKPKVLLGEEPTQGVDAGARVDIYRILRETADAGAAVVVLSSDGVELQGLCDRVFIMSRGAIVEELVGDAVTEAAITSAALTSTSTVEHAAKRQGRFGGFKGWLRGDSSPAAVLGLIFLLLGVVVSITNPAYFSPFNINNLLLLAAPLILVGAAQQVVVLGAGFDLSVGPLMGFLVVISSFWVVDGGNFLVGFGLMILGALGVGFINGVLVTRFNINPVVATLAMFIALQGIYLSLRSTPGGIIADSVMVAISSRVSIVPVVTIVAAALALILEWGLRRSKWGVQLRAVGSRRDAAERLGIPAKRVIMMSYVLCSILVLPAAVIMMAQIGIGDGGPSISYTLSSVTIVVLAGASIFGGRGSFLGILAAALLVEQVVNISPFLGLSSAWSYWLPGLITLVAAVTYTAIRGSRRKAAR